MALYLGSSEINPVETVEVIKEVPTEQDLTLMGNELRRAYCWTRQENLNGQCQIYDAYTNNFSTSFQATNVKVNETNSSSSISRSNTTAWTTGYIIIDGKLYTFSSNNTSVVLTQKGTNTGYEDTSGNSIFVRNGKIYSSFNDAENETNSIGNALDFKKYSGGYSTYAYYINDGKFYQGSTQLLTSYTKIKNIAMYFDSASYYNIMNNDNKIYKIKKDGSYVSQVYDGTVTNNILKYGGSTTYFCFFVNNVVYAYFSNYSSSSFSKRVERSYDYAIKDLIYYGSSIYVLLTSNEVYYINISSDSSTLILSNVKCFLNNDNGSLPQACCLTNDNKIYKFSSGTTSLQHTFSSNVQFLQPGDSISLCCFKYTDDEIVTHKLYTTQYTDEITKAYTSNLNNNYLKYNITSKTPNTITVNGEVYTRDGANDLVFDFVPEDLENHTFTDTDLLQAYLDAGIRQQQNNT